MPPERRSPEDPEQWLSRAQGSLALAKAGAHAAGVFYEDLCFQTQQAAEKAIKAVFVSRKIRFPKTHDLSNLLTILHGVGIEVPDPVRHADLLTQYAVEARYPGLAAVDEEKYLQAMDMAEQVCRWAETLVRATKGGR